MTPTQKIIIVSIQMVPREAISMLAYYNDTEILYRKFKFDKFCSIFQSEILNIQESLSYYLTSHYHKITLFAISLFAFLAIKGLQNLTISIQNLIFERVN